MTLFSLLFFLYIPFYLSEVLCELQLAPFLLYRHEERGLQCCLFLWMPPTTAVSAAVSAGVRVRSSRHQGRAVSASESAQQPKLGTDKQAIYAVVVFPSDLFKRPQNWCFPHGTENVELPFLSNIRLKTSEVIQAINHYSISPKERRQLLTIPLLSAKQFHISTSACQGLLLHACRSNTGISFWGKTTIKPKLHYNKYRGVQF